MASGGTSAKVFELSILRRDVRDEAEDDARLRKVFGSKRSKAYAKMLQRVNVPKTALRYLPEMKPVDACPVGSQTRKLLSRIEYNYENKPRKRDLILDEPDHGRERDGNDNQAEDDGTASDADSDDNDNDESESESELELEEPTSSGSSESSDSSAEDEGLHQGNQRESKLERWDDLDEILHPPKEEELPRVVVGRLHALDPAEYKVPDLTSVGQDLDLGEQEEPVVAAIPGFAAQPNPISRSRGAEKFFNYVGRWNAGSLSGEGVYIFADGETYRGSWLDNLPHGRGIAKYPDGSSYEGDWVKGLKHGEGTYVSANGSRYEGAFENGRRTGRGKLTLVSRLTFEGDFVNGQFHGRGSMKSPLGFEYSGTWARGLILGTGALVDKDGNRTVKTWKRPITFRRAILGVKEDQENRIRRKNDFKLRLRALLFDMDLQRHVRHIREDMAQAELDRIEAEREELDRLRYERREQIRKAKEDALNGINSDDDDDDDDDDEEEEDEEDDDEEEEDEEDDD